MPSSSGDGDDNGDNGDNAFSDESAALQPLIPHDFPEDEPTGGDQQFHTATAEVLPPIVPHGAEHAHNRKPDITTALDLPTTGPSPASEEMDVVYAAFSLDYFLTNPYNHIFSLPGACAKNGAQDEGERSRRSSCTSSSMSTAYFTLYHIFITDEVFFVI
ncbi:hypothetical protein SCHPADRAFT_947394 [Schizopora paradoxa]|uniref:Uncharacterized protein n=1 Tax=Schizopora paradoxa TaxID=27342 RepID=A0A0H2RJ57_9AGAM|nr:hypothetical protein SCHPADRAFT_947394 [Schizopora paradoxa]